MSKRKFEEEVVEETTTETVSETPDTHDQFVSILVDMGLSAEQAEAVHSMAMDLINAGDGETTETTEEVSETKVEARRARRGRGKRSEFSRRRGDATPRGRRFSEETSDKLERMERRMRRLARQNRELRQELSSLGARPAARPLSNAPIQNEAPATGVKTLSKSTQAALDMINSMKK